MGAGEYVSVRSQRELLAASAPGPTAHTAVPLLDVNANELALVYRARGMPPEEAAQLAGELLRHYPNRLENLGGPSTEGHDVVGTGIGAALSSFCFFATGAAIPVLPFLFGLTETAALIVAVVLVGLALLLTGAVVGVLSGGPPLRRGLRQLAIGLGAAGVTYVLGMLFGASLG
jgi:VIT1/CCC1 family predicted Fe2+/Mn2+ transporter